jgi:uncharacterized delta-60 repeat protein
LTVADAVQEGRAMRGGLRRSLLALFLVRGRRGRGRIVIAGTGNALSDVAVQALLPSGEGDPSLDAEGSLAINLGGSDVASALALQPDGKIAAAGSTSAGAGGTTDLAVLRVNADGSDDVSFNGTGRRIIDYGNSVDDARDIALRPDGRFVVVGLGNLNSEAAIQALLPNGQGDPGVLNGARSGSISGASTTRRRPWPSKRTRRSSSPARPAAP